jgi:bifunctional non-homologous end joining protein LigD
MQTTEQAESITLYFREGSSDKVYQAAIEPSGTGFVVNFAYGRRGGTLQTGAKTASPVSYDQAKKVYDKLVKEKTTKGYTPGENGTPYQHTDKANRATGILPQLLNPIDESELPRLLNDQNWWAQEKFDGKRVLIRKEENQITGINRKGLVIDLPWPIVNAVQSLDARRCLLDGEAVGDAYIAFDLLQEASLDLKSYPFHARLGHLVDLVKTGAADFLRVAGTAIGKGAKEKLLARLRQQKREGIVFKEKNAPYTPGRPASGGTQLKLKFCATASCIVAGANGSKRSVKLELIDARRRVSVGNVTTPSDWPYPLDRMMSSRRSSPARDSPRRHTHTSPGSCHSAHTSPACSVRCRCTCSSAESGRTPRRTCWRFHRPGSPGRLPRDSRYSIAPRHPPRR